MSNRLRILIVDDHPIVRQGVKQTLADAVEAGEIVEIGEASTPQEALNLVRGHEWDAVVLDIGLPGGGGIDVLKDIKEVAPRLPVLVLSMNSEDQYAVRALRAGAAGYLTKEAASGKLVDAIRQVVSGRRFISAEVAEALAFELTIDATQPLHALLSDREFDVLRLIASGRTVGDIAAHLASASNRPHHRARIQNAPEEQLGLMHALTNRLLD